MAKCLCCGGEIVSWRGFFVTLVLLVTVIAGCLYALSEAFKCDRAVEGCRAKYSAFIKNLSCYQLEYLQYSPQQVLIVEESRLLNWSDMTGR